MNDILSYIQKILILIDKNIITTGKNIEQTIIQKFKPKKGFKESLEYYHDEYDPKENKETEIPEGENVMQHCIWLLEVYNPDSFNNLINNLNKLGWKRSPGYSDNEKFSEIIQGIRKNNSHSWHNLGYILPTGTKSLLEKKKANYLMV